jgi:hypothetical protein
MGTNSKRKAGRRHDVRDQFGVRREMECHAAFVRPERHRTTIDSLTLESGVAASAIGGAPGACESVSRK